MAKAPKADAAADQTAETEGPAETQTLDQGAGEQGPAETQPAELAQTGAAAEIPAGAPTPTGAAQAFHDEFTANLPPGAEAGTYAASAHDGFAGRVFDGLHGVVVWGEWAFKFAEGRFEEALHRHREVLVFGAVDGEKTDVA